jgi:predicted AAA+ superfamily ATPase
MIRRNITEELLAALADTPVVALNGARQTGKSTLARTLAQSDHPATYLTMDDADVLDAATRDAAAFLRGLPGPVILDEVQRVPELLLAIKAAVDRNRVPGRFFLTGSAQLLLLPRLADTLAGRIEVLTLWPFSQGELAGVRESFIARAFSDGEQMPSGATTGPASTALDPDHLVDVLAGGGFPEAVARSSPARRAAWFSSYVTTVTERTIRDVAEIAGFPDLRRLLAALAARSGSLLNFADLSRTLGMPQTTLKRYASLLEIAFLVQRLPAWSVNVTSRLVKTPKAYVTDSGLLVHLIGADSSRLRVDRDLLGQVLESFVVGELYRQSTWSEPPVRLYHFRTHAGRGVDIVLEAPGGRVVGVEVKLTASPGSADFDGLRALAEEAGRRFVRGVVLCRCERSIPFGPRLQTMPLSELWT